MKKDRRQQLSHNDLAKWLETKIEAIKANSSLLFTLVLGLLLIAIVFSSWKWFNKSNKAGFSQDVAATVLFGTEDTELAQMLLKYPKGNEHANFQLLGAETLVMQAERAMMTDRNDAKTKLENALEKLSVASQEAKEPLLMDRITWTSARAREILSALREGDDLDEAKKLYETLAAKENSIYTQLSKDQLEAINRPWISAFLTASRNYQPPAPINPEFDPTLPEPGSASSSIDSVLNIDPTVPETVVPEDIVLPEPEPQNEDAAALETTTPPAE